MPIIECLGLRHWWTTTEVNTLVAVNTYTELRSWKTTIFRSSLHMAFSVKPDIKLTKVDDVNWFKILGVTHHFPVPQVHCQLYITLQSP